MTRQKEVACGVQEYATDFSDRLPQSVATIGTGSYWNWTEPMMLTGYRARSPGLHRSMAEYLRDYIPDPRILSCPSAPRPYSYLEQAWSAGDAWDHPGTAPVQDPVSGNTCLWWGYTGYLSETGKLFHGPSNPGGGGRESGLVMSTYLGYDHWRNPRQFSSCERFVPAQGERGNLVVVGLLGRDGRDGSGSGHSTGGTGTGGLSGWACGHLRAPGVDGDQGDLEGGERASRIRRASGRGSFSFRGKRYGNDYFCEHG